MTQVECKGNKLSGWLIRVALFFSVIAFSGYPGSANQTFLQKPRTELLVSKNNRSSKQTLSFKKAVGLFPVVKPSKALADGQKKALIIYNRLSKVKVETLSKRYNSYTLPISSSLVKTIPQSSDEENDAALKG